VIADFARLELSNFWKSPGKKPYETAESGQIQTARQRKTGRAFKAFCNWCKNRFSGWGEAGPWPLKKQSHGFRVEQPALSH
jgi:hypothetical protein